MKILISISLLFASINIFSKCNTSAIEMKHESGFSISFGGGGGGKSSFNDESTINVPLSINGEAACFKKKSSFKIKTEEKTDESKGKLVISPLDVEFENIPAPSIKQYLFAEKSNDLTQMKFYTMSFVCSGEIPLSIEATSDSYLEVLTKPSEGSISVHSYFATGVAADNLKPKVNNTKAKEAFNFFATKYQINQEKPADVVCCNHKIPSIISSTSIESLTGIERSITSSFTTMGSYVPNGCSKEFSSKMNNYLIENYEKNESLEPFNISKKWFKKDLLIEWKNKK